MNSPGPDLQADGRLRAAVRALLSRGVWCVIGAQLGLIILWRRFFSVDAGTERLEMLLLAFALAGFLYVTAGVSQALANSRETVGIRAALRAGTRSYGPFLWMIAKLALLSGVLLNLVVYLGGEAGAGESPAWSKQVAGYLPLIQGLIGFVFVYWLPIVFVRRNFALFETLRAALVTARQALPRAGYLAFLTLTPALLATVADASMPLIAVLLLNLLGGVMEWIAYIYCVGWLQDKRST